MGEVQLGLVLELGPERNFHLRLVVNLWGVFRPPFGAGDRGEAGDTLGSLFDDCRNHSAVFHFCDAKDHEWSSSWREGRFRGLRTSCSNEDVTEYARDLSAGTTWFHFAVHLAAECARKARQIGI